MSWTHERARVAALARCVRNGERPADDPALAEARTRLQGAIAAARIERIISAEPPMTAGERRHLVELLLGGAA